jgi:hypothetical protein
VGLARLAAALPVIHVVVLGCARGHRNARESTRERFRAWWCVLAVVQRLHREELSYRCKCPLINLQLGPTVVQVWKQQISDIGCSSNGGQHLALKPAPGFETFTSTTCLFLPNRKEPHAKLIVACRKSICFCLDRASSPAGRPYRIYAVLIHIAWES